MKVEIEIVNGEITAYDKAREMAKAIIDECLEKLKSGDLKTPEITLDTPKEEIEKMSFIDAYMGLMRLLLLSGRGQMTRTFDENIHPCKGCKVLQNMRNEIETLNTTDSFDEIFKTIVLDIIDKHIKVIEE